MKQTIAVTGSNGMIGTAVVKQLQGAGFRVRDYDRSDTPAARSLGRALGWDRPDLGARAMDLESNLFALYTLVERS
mgnify:CR=1 FL=1